jgi:predicted nucleic acid-binding protein
MHTAPLKKKKFQDFKKYTVVTTGKIEIQVIKEDLSDNRLRAAALEGNAEYIVSGDPHLQNLKTYRAIKIVSPAEFVKIISY